MSFVRKGLPFLYAVVLFTVASVRAAENHPPLDKLTLIVPSVPGSGWDQLARAMEQTLKDASLVGETKIENIPGDGGLKGLAQFIATRRGDGRALLMGGVTMIRAANSSHSTASLSQTAPIARLTGEYQVIAVRGGPGGNDVRSLDDLAEAYLANPKRLTRMPAVPGRGIDPALVNWRGVFAPPGLSAEQTEILSGVIDRMAKTPQWQAELERGHWADLYLSGNSFAKYLASQSIKVVPDQPRPAIVWRTQMWILHNGYRLALLVGLAVAIPIGLLIWQRRAAKPQTQQVAPEVSDQIDRQFKEWGLTVAERDVALLILKGLRHKEIADLRGTSERTVRQQATMMYKKAGISGRTDLAAFFLFDS